MNGEVIAVGVLVILALGVTAAGLVTACGQYGTEYAHGVRDAVCWLLGVSFLVAMVLYVALQGGAP